MSDIDKVGKMGEIFGERFTHCWFWVFSWDVLFKIIVLNKMFKTAVYVLEFNFVFYVINYKEYIFVVVNTVLYSLCRGHG